MGICVYEVTGSLSHTTAAGWLGKYPCGDVRLSCVEPARVVCFYFFYLFIFILATLGLRCCAQAFSSCGEQGPLFAAVRRLLIAGATLVVEHGL